MSAVSDFACPAGAAVERANVGRRQRCTSSLPIRIAVDSTLRHGLLAGARLAAAVVESRFAAEGLMKTHARCWLR